MNQPQAGDDVAHLTDTDVRPDRVLGDLVENQHDDHHHRGAGERDHASPGRDLRPGVHPGVLDAYLSGRFGRALDLRPAPRSPAPHALTAEEDAVLRLIRGAPALDRAA